MPVYRPLKGWENNIIRRILHLAKQLEVEVRLIVVDDGNNCREVDAAMAVLERKLSHSETVKLPQNTGKGNALRTGLEKVKGEHTILTDVDLPFSDSSYLQVYRELLQGADAVLGKRNREYLRNLPVSRRLISQTFHRVSRMLSGIKVEADTQAGIKGLSRRGREVFLKTSIRGYLADFEFLRMSMRNNLNVVAVPVEVVQHKTVAFSTRILLKEFTNFFRILVR